MLTAQQALHGEAQCHSVVMRGRENKVIGPPIRKQLK